MPIKKFANRKYENSRDSKRKLTPQYSSWAELKTVMLIIILDYKDRKTHVNGRTTVVLLTALLKLNLKIDFGTRLRYYSF